eukprot:6304419-Amphidinium_carterae.1
MIIQATFCPATTAEPLTKACCVSPGGLQAPLGPAQGGVSHQLAALARVSAVASRGVRRRSLRKL